MTSKAMKLILTGTTGFIGREVLSQALAHPSITSIVALTRHPLPATFASSSNPKLQNVLIDDFLNYTPSVLEQLSGADGCIWCIGAKTPDPTTTRKVTLEYALTAVNAFSHLPRNEKEGKKFHFVFTSGILNVREGRIWLPYGKEARRIGGETETKLEEFGKQHEGFDIFIARPSGVTPKGRGVLKSIAASVVPMIRVDELAAAMVDIAVNAGEKGMWENRDLAEKGREVLGEKR